MATKAEFLEFPKMIYKDGGPGIVVHTQEEEDRLIRPARAKAEKPVEKPVERSVEKPAPPSAVEKEAPKPKLKKSKSKE